jgi:hypothetical protein
MTQKQKVRNIALEKNAGSSGIMSVEKGLFYFYFLFFIAHSPNTVPEAHKILR